MEGARRDCRDLIEQREADDLPILFETQVERLEDVVSAPKIHFTEAGQRRFRDATLGLPYEI